MSKKMEPKDQTLLNFVTQETKRIQQDRANYLKAHDMKDFFTPPKGTTKAALLARMPRLVKGNFGDRRAFRIEVNGIVYDWTVNPNSPTYRALLAHLMEGPVDFELIKTGEGKSTRYDVVF